jgi:hypothetical protein
MIDGIYLYDFNKTLTFILAGMRSTIILKIRDCL